jgi:hypothetical protein
MWDREETTVLETPFIEWLGKKPRKHPDFMYE